MLAHEGRNPKKPNENFLKVETKIHPKDLWIKSYGFYFFLLFHSKLLAKFIFVPILPVLNP